MTTIYTRYTLGTQILSSFSIFKTKEIEEFYGFDNVLKQDVLIKTYTLPTKEEAKRLAITLWEREIRLTRKALGLNGGTRLLNLQDAFFEKDSNKLVIVHSKYGKSLEEWMEHLDGLWFLKDLNPKSRKEVWKLFKSLLNGIGALHEAKLLHRNINPSTIFYSDIFEENILKIGGFTWSLYLHNLNFIPERLGQRKKGLSLFQAPETYSVENHRQSRANPFAGDIFSLGMVLCYLFYTNFPKNSISSLKEWNSNYENILNFITNSSSGLNTLEIELISRCISKDPKDRPKTIEDLLKAIFELMEQFEGESNIFTEQPKVNWYNFQDSGFLRRVSLLTYSPFDEILQNPDGWLTQNFKSALIYATGIEHIPLVVLSNKNIPFSLKPAYNRRNNSYNHELLTLDTIHTKERSKVLRTIRNKNHIAVFKNGFQFTLDLGYREPQSPWRRLWKIAQKELQDKKESKNEEETLIDSLEIMLKAEDLLDSKKIVFFRANKRPRRIPANELEIAELEVSLDFDKEMKGKLRRDLIKLISEYRYKNGGEIELSASNNPSSAWNHNNQWRIKSFKEKDLKIKIERTIKKKNKALLREGVIRPFEMNLSLNLYRRKERGIETTKYNDLLLSAFLNPWYRTFYLGFEYDIEDKTVSDILNTIPMYLVQGPPGTGKTWVASSVVAEILARNPYARILISSKDHHPLDHLVEAVIGKLPKDLDPPPVIIRTISTEKEREYQASDFVMNFTEVERTKEILKKAIENTSKIKNISSQVESKWREILRENSNNPSLRWMDEVKKTANILFATSTSSSLEWLSKTAAPYDWVILEEAAKSYPIELLLPMNLGHRWLLIGDQKQLPPYMYNDMEIAVSDIIDEDQTEEERDDLEYEDFRNECLKNIKFFENLFEKFERVKAQSSRKEAFPCSQLEKQWRLPPIISQMISKTFYDTQFTIMTEAPKDNDPFENPDFLTNHLLIWIDTPHISINKLYMEREGSEGSIFNTGEVNLIVRLVKKLKLNEQLKANNYKDVIFLTPYAAQKEELSNAFYNNVISSFKAEDLSHNCHTVDSYQGKQADIVIVSLVRNNEKSDLRSSLGFLTADERLNVMFSRVRKRMVIIGCSEQFKKFKDSSESKAINEIFQFVKENGLVLKSEDLEETS